MTAPLSLLTVHAHPDDEASKGASTVAKYKAEGVRTTLVCCTGGEAGDILNPAMDTPEVRSRIDEVRRDELALAAQLIGYDRVVMLGYRDSGMPDTPDNADPRCFARSDFDEAVGRLVEVIRTERPQVIITYADDQEGYPHPDHLQVHDISLPAFEAAGDPDAFPEPAPLAAPEAVLRGLVTGPHAATHAKFTELGLESPFTEQWFERPSQDHRITTKVPTDGYQDVRLEALLAHATQVDPASPFWFGLPREVSRQIHPFDDYILAKSLVDLPPYDAEHPETDLFAGLRP